MTRGVTPDDRPYYRGSSDETSAASLGAGPSEFGAGNIANERLPREDAQAWQFFSTGTPHGLSYNGAGHGLAGTAKAL